MNRLKRFTITVCLVMLGQLSANTAHAWPVPAVLVHSADRVASAAGYASQIQPIIETDPVRSVQRQRALVGEGCGNVILWPGVWPHARDNFAALLAEAAKHPCVFTHVYLVQSDGDAMVQTNIHRQPADKVQKQGDELFWCPTGICMGQDEALMQQAARMAHAHGLKTICTILPDVILDPRFALQDISMCDGIAVDAYPSIRPTVPDFGGCRFNDNHIANLYYCSFQKLDRMGHLGDKGCLAQAFAVTTEPVASLRAGLALQRQALTHAKALGCDYISPWGLYLSEEAMRKEPISELPKELAWMVQP